MYEDPKLTDGTSLEDRAANVLNFVMGGAILLAVTVVAFLVVADTLWRIGDILQGPTVDLWREASPGLLALGFGLQSLSMLIGLIRKAFPKRPAA